MYCIYNWISFYKISVFLYQFHIIFFFLISELLISENVFFCMMGEGTHFHQYKGSQKTSTLSFLVWSFDQTDYCYFVHYSIRDNHLPNVSLGVTFARRFYYTIDTSTFSRLNAFVDAHVNYCGQQMHDCNAGMKMVSRPCEYECGLAEATDAKMLCHTNGICRVGCGYECAFWVHQVRHIAFDRIYN